MDRVMATPLQLHADCRLAAGRDTFDEVVPDTNEPPYAPVIPTSLGTAGRACWRQQSSMTLRKTSAELYRQP
jgi:hypothetical protein